MKQTCATRFAIGFASLLLTQLDSLNRPSFALLTDRPVTPILSNFSTFSTRPTYCKMQCNKTTVVWEQCLLLFVCCCLLIWVCFCVLFYIWVHMWQWRHKRYNQNSRTKIGLLLLGPLTDAIDATKVTWLHIAGFSAAIDRTPSVEFTKQANYPPVGRQSNSWYPCSYLCHTFISVIWNVRFSCSWNLWCVPENGLPVHDF